MEFQRIEAGPAMTEAEASSLPPLLLAYVGDAVYELVVRAAGMRAGMTAERLHGIVVDWVCADGQHAVWHHLQDHLTDAEADIARRGRNAKGSVPQGRSPAAYRMSTAVEALIGYLWMTGNADRIDELLRPATMLIAEGRGPDALEEPRTP